MNLYSQLQFQEQDSLRSESVNTSSAVIYTDGKYSNMNVSSPYHNVYKINPMFKVVFVLYLLRGRDSIASCGKRLNRK